jgi:hypothetical protein
METKESQYIRVGEYSIDEVLPYVVNTATMMKLKKQKLRPKHPEFKAVAEKDYDGHMVKMYSQRYQLFASKGVVCVECGIEGKYFALERSRYQEGNRCHFNLYGINEAGEEVLITKDHIIPKSKGGKNHLNNYQVMCFECNVQKSDSIDSIVELPPNAEALLKQAGMSVGELPKTHSDFNQKLWDAFNCGREYERKSS